MEDNIKKMKAWIEDQAKHEDVAVKAEGYRKCIPAFDNATAVLDLEQMVLDAKRQLCLVAAGKSQESTVLCYRIIAINRVIQKWRDIQ